jgi:putative oxidoreductase
MEKTLAPFAPYAYAIMRIILGLLFVSHGGQKLFGWFGGQPVPLGSLFGVAGIIEIVLGLLITLGLFTGYAAFIASGEMAVAYFIGHFPKVFGRLKTQASRRCCSALSFCIWQLKVRGSGLSMQHGALRGGALLDQAVGMFHLT